MYMLIIMVLQVQLLKIIKEILQFLVQQLKKLQLQQFADQRLGMKRLYLQPGGSLIIKLQKVLKQENICQQVAL